MRRKKTRGWRGGVSTWNVKLAEKVFAVESRVGVEIVERGGSGVNGDAHVRPGTTGLGEAINVDVVVGPVECPVLHVRVQGNGEEGHNNSDFRRCRFITTGHHSDHSTNKHAVVTAIHCD